jgi:hypothetical protein
MIPPVDPRKQLEDSLVAKIQKYEDRGQQKIDPTTGQPIPRGFWGSLGHGLAQTGLWQNTASEKLKRAGNEQNVKDLNALEQRDVGMENAKSLAGLRDAQADYNRAHGNAIDLHTITDQEAQAMGQPLLAGQQLTQPVFQHLMGNKTTMDKDTADNATKLQVQQLKANMAALKPEQRDDHAIRLMQMQDAGQKLNPTDASYLKAYGQYVEQNKVMPGVRRMDEFAKFAPVQVVGENGEVLYANRMTAQGQEAPSSIPFQTQRRMAAWITSGKGGTTMTNYRTANDHLDLLSDVSKALGNGDVQTLNRLNVEFQRQFGKSAPTNLDAVKAMLSGELANVSKVSGATDPEILAMKAQINEANSPEQIDGIINTNQHLMDQKASEMYRQYQAGITGQPVFENKVKKLAGEDEKKNPTTQNAPSNTEIPAGATGKFTVNGKTYYHDAQNRNLGEVKK